MKRVKKIIILLAVPLMAELAISCCGCIETTFFNYTNCSLSVYNLDNSGAFPFITQSSSIPENAYGIRISINRTENTCRVRGKNSLFFQAAYATSCDCPPEFQYMPLDSILSVKITTRNDFDPEHLGGSDVSELFYVFQGNEFATISEYVENLETELYDFVASTLEFDLLLMTTPLIDTEHQFEVSVKLSDGRVLNAQTETIELRR